MMLSIQLFKLCRLATVVAAMALPPGLLLDIGAHSVETLPACGLASSGCAFTIRNIAYQKYEPFPGTIDQGLDSITMAFDVTNDANGINTACSFVNGKWDGQWMDYGTKWYTCGNRTVEDDTGTKYVVATIAQFDWDTWNLAINQTWVCGDTYNTQ